MSACIVENETIARVINHLYVEDMRHAPHDRIESLLRIAGQQALPTDRSYDLFRKLGQAMLDLNVRSYNERYPRNPNGPETYEHTNHNPNRIQAYKSLRCYLYQSCEGECDKAPLYVALDEYADSLARDIVSDLPEYDSAEWG
jgi:hypothetical protein